jgi:hypothetical protein
MIPDEFVKQLFSKGNNLLKQLDPDETLPTQIYRGMNPFSIDCMRHMTVFTRFNVIPKSCFSCYKVMIEPQTVMQLFKLMVIFHELKPPNDNARKCMVECRKHVSGAYKGYIYCSSIEEAEQVKEWVQRLVSEQISRDIPVTLKRGCSEYALSYPEYAQIGQDATPMMYREEWREYEELVDKDFVFETQPTTFNRSEYSFSDAKIMLAWLKYAAMIGDQSYLGITGESLPVSGKLNCPAISSET